MKYQFLYIDDEPQKAKGIIKPIQSSNITIVTEAPLSWNDQKKNLIEESKLNQFDGLLLDLKLEFSDGTNNIKYKGSDLAQSIRTEIKSGHTKDLPIFLCTTDNNLRAIFDRTSSDLFDLVFNKDDFNKHDVEIQNEFISFASSYHEMNKDKSFEAIFNKTLDSFDELLPINLELKKCTTSHEISYFVKNHVIMSSGVLINEMLLALRLGIDIKCSPDWKKVKMLLDKFKYHGVFSKCYERWWNSDISTWWKDSFNNSFLNLSSREKVNLIIEKYGFNELKHIDLPTNHRYDTYWYQCRLSETPLDPSDALRTVEMPRFSWQDPSYISYHYLKSDERDREKIENLLGANELKVFQKM